MIQFGVVLVPPGWSVAPWQYTPAHVVVEPSKDGVAPSAVARPPKVSSAGSAESRWPGDEIDAGLMWHSVQSMGARHVDVARWLWCAPTPRAEVEVFPLVSRGGAGSLVATVP